MVRWMTAPSAPVQLRLTLDQSSVKLSRSSWLYSGISSTLISSRRYWIAPLVSCTALIMSRWEVLVVMRLISAHGGLVFKPPSLVERSFAAPLATALMTLATLTAVAPPISSMMLGMVPWMDKREMRALSVVPARPESLASAEGSP